MSETFASLKSCRKVKSPGVKHLESEETSGNLSEVYKQLLQREAELDIELRKFTDTSSKQKDLRTVMDQLHRYNDVKDATQVILGSLANLEGTTVGELHKKYDLTSNSS